MATSLAEYLSRRASDAFRGLARYDDGDLELLHVRDGLDRAAMARRADAIHGAVCPRGEDGVMDELGPQVATIQLREDAVILHLPVSETGGYLVGLEPEIARDLSTFVHDCVRIIDQAGEASE